MAFKFTNSKGKTYYLHATTLTLKSGPGSPLYFFSPALRDGALDAVPHGYDVVETSNGLPVLKKHYATRNSGLAGDSGTNNLP